MPDVQLPFALSVATGWLMHVDAVPNGDDCGCVCPECAQAVQAVQGPINAHHFRHRPDYDHTRCDPVQAYETMKHRRAKEVLMGATTLISPALIAVCGQHAPKLVEPQAPIMLGGVRRLLEPTHLGSFKPDVLFQFDDRELAIEVRVAHRTRQAKQDEFARLGMDAIEIDLRGVPDEDVAIDARFVPIVLQAAGRHWLFNRGQAAANEAYRLELWEIHRQRAEVMRKRAEAAAADTARREATRLLEAERERKRLVEREQELVEQRAELARRREAALARVAEQRDTSKLVAAEAARVPDRVAGLRALPHVVVPEDQWPPCRRVEDGLTYDCHTPFLWLQAGRGWRCVTCDPPIGADVALTRVRGLHG